MSHTNSFNTIDSYNNVWNNCTITDSGSRLFTWLSPLEPRLQHQDIRERRVKGVGEWLLQTEEFRSWCAGSKGGESDGAVLFCYGDPGVGKTYICSLAIDTLCDRARGKNVAVACFYFDFAAQKEHTSTSTLGALLKQVLSGLEEIPEEITEAYEDQKKVIGGRGPQLSDVVEMLQATSSKKHTFICIDALDECAAGCRVELLDSLRQILQKSPGTRILVVGRPHIQDEIGKRLSGRVMAIAITPRRDDVIGYIRTRLDNDTNPDAMDSNLEADILKKIPNDISEIFLLVSLNIDAILQETTIHRRRQKLYAMTGSLGLGDAYGATLDRIKGQSREKARLSMAILMWISHAERPLKADELRHALAVEIGSPILNSDNIPSIGTLLSCCQGLVVVDKEASTIRLIHLTLQEYLRVHPELFGRAHSTIAETCLSYLNSQQVKALSTNPSSDLQSTPFLEYSSLYWGTHAKRDLSDCAKLLALKLLDEYSNRISAEILLKAQGSYVYGIGFHRLSLFSGLHCAAIFGIDEIVASLVEMEGCDINQKDSVGNTPLVWAARNGHGGVVKILVGRDDISPDKPGGDGQTPLCCSARTGHEGVVKILLGRGDVDPNAAGVLGQTPLWWASLNGHEGVVEILLDRDDVNPDTPDMYGQTPLWCATRNGHEGVIKMLLGQDDVNPNKPNKFGETPLWWATKKGHEGIVKILLGRNDVNPDKPDKDGQTPLWWAAKKGQEGVVKILLGRDDVNPNTPNEDGQTPLCWAAKLGYEEIVKILLGRGDVNPDTPNENGQTPLCLATYNRHEGVVKILLGRDNINPNKSNKFGETPLCWAAKKGHEGMVKILLGRDDVNPTTPDMHGQTPLCLATCNGHERVVKILLGQDDVNPTTPNKFGETPLWWATKKGHQGIVKILLGRDDINPDSPDKDGQTPLCCASRNRHEGVVEILLRRDDVNPNKPNKFGETPLWWAAKKGHEGIVKILLRRDDVNPNKPDKDGSTPLSCAAWNGREGVVKILLGRDDVNPDNPDKDGQTPLCCAAWNGHKGVVKILLRRNDVSPDKLDKDGQTPLCYAAWNGHEGVVKMLLGRNDVNPYREDRHGHTPLWWAARRGHLGVVALLQPPAFAARSTA